MVLFTTKQIFKKKFTLSLDKCLESEWCLLIILQNHKLLQVKTKFGLIGVYHNHEYFSNT